MENLHLTPYMDSGNESSDEDEDVQTMSVSSPPSWKEDSRLSRLPHGSAALSPIRGIDRPDTLLQSRGNAGPNGTRFSESFSSNNADRLTGRTPQFSRDSLLAGRSLNSGQKHVLTPLDGSDNVMSSTDTTVPVRNTRPMMPTEVSSPRRQHSTGNLFVDTVETKETISEEKDNLENKNPVIESSEDESESGEETDEEEEYFSGEKDEGQSDEEKQMSGDKDENTMSDASDDDDDDKLEYHPEPRLNQTMPEMREPQYDTLAPLSQTLRINSAPLSEPLNRPADSISQKSFMSTSIIPAISSKAARMKSFLTGGLRNVGSLLGTEELERHFPDRQVKIYIATWNMHEEKLLPKSIEDLLIPEDIDYLADFYVIGLQEATPFKDEWEIKIQETLGPSHVQLHSASFGVLHLVIFVRREYIWFCSPVEEDTIATRPGSMIKTKGAIGLSFNFFGTSFIFISSHFTSDEGKVNERVEDFRKICQGLQLPKEIPVMYPYQSERNDVTTKFDYVFWCGDLNFRLTKSREEVDKILASMKKQSSPDYEDLVQYDQLNAEIEKGNIFKGFKEEPIRFYPSYKFDLNSDNYDSSPKTRIPSYTDRVLCKSRKPNDMKILTYNSCNSIKISDHRPVYATIQVRIRPGKDGMPLSGGIFNRNVFMEGYKRRTEKSRKHQKNSSVCSIQ
ncbi:phosphatidylinositol polyphosphate 5-phosphatase type IV-like [Glandiceps talaboti]